MKRLLFFMLLATQVAAAQFPVTEVNRTFQRIDDGHAQIIDDIVLDVLTDCDVPGGSVGVVIDGEIAYISGYGFRDDNFGSCSSIVDGYTKFYTASIIKPLTGILVNMIAAEYSVFTIDDEVEDWLPQLTHFHGSGIRVRDLMDHSANMSNASSDFDMTAAYGLDVCFAGPWGGSNTYSDFYPLYDAVSALDVVDDVPLHSGNAASPYSSAHYMILGAVAQVVTGRRYTELMREYLSEPLDMHHLKPSYAWREFGNTTERFGPSGQLLSDPEQSYSWKLPAGGWLATPVDYALFMKACLDETVDLSVREGVYGFNSSGEFLFHTGSSRDGGYRTGVSIWSDSEIGVVWFGNHKTSQKNLFYSLDDSIKQAIIDENIGLEGSAFDSTERSLGVEELEGDPYSSIDVNDYPIIWEGNGDVLTVLNFKDHSVSTLGIPVMYGDVRVWADDRVRILPGTRLANRFVAFIDNVGDEVYGDGYACITDAPTRSAEDEAVEVGATGLTLWPNPSDGRFRIDGLREQDRLIVLDMVGRVVLERAVLDERGMELDVSAQPPGIYFARVLSKDGAADTRRFVIR